MFRLRFEVLNVFIGNLDEDREMIFSKFVDDMIVRKSKFVR